MAKGYSVPKGVIHQPLTIRQMEALRKENLKKSRAELMQFELDVLTTPKKPVKSVPKLRDAVGRFFLEHKDDKFLTVNELAMDLGYADEDSLIKDSFNEDNRPEYNAILRKAVAKIETVMTRTMLGISINSGNTRGFEQALIRMDKKRDKYDPFSHVESASTTTNNTDMSVHISLQMKEDEKIKTMLDDRLGSLLAAQRSGAIDVQASRIREIEEPVPVAEEVMVEADKEAVNA